MVCYSVPVKWPSPARVALAIGGSDSSGGAGVAVDLRVFALAGLHSAVALTCVTAQRPGAVLGIHPVPPQKVKAQLDAVAAATMVAVVKTGMLFSKAIIEVVSHAIRRHHWRRVVVDPVMVAASGDPLLQPPALKSMRDEIVPLATVVTPNLYEAALLLGRPVTADDDLLDVARELARQYHTAMLLKGGHRAGDRIENVYADGRRVWRSVIRRATDVSDHGAGCLLAALLAAHLALGRTPLGAARAAVNGTSAAFHRAYAVGQIRLANAHRAWRR